MGQGRLGARPRPRAPSHPCAMRHEPLTIDNLIIIVLFELCIIGFKVSKFTDSKFQHFKISQFHFSNFQYVRNAQLLKRITNNSFHNSWNIISNDLEMFLRVSLVTFVYSGSRIREVGASSNTKTRNEISQQKLMPITISKYWLTVLSYELTEQANTQPKNANKSLNALPLWSPERDSIELVRPSSLGGQVCVVFFVSITFDRAMGQPMARPFAETTVTLSISYGAGPKRSFSKS